MDKFHIIEDAYVVLKTKGVFHQKKVYRYGPRLFAAYGAGFIRLGGSGATSAPNVSYENLDIPFVADKGQTGEPIIPANLSFMQKVA